MQDTLSYMYGFGNHFESESVPGALIKGRNSPQKVPLGLYAEQLSGAAFTSPRHTNLRSWLYRIRPSVLHSHFAPVAHPLLTASTSLTPPTQMRWDPPPYPQEPLHFIESLIMVASNGALELHVGAAIHWYRATASMQNVYFYNADGELLIVPQEGKLLFETEFGKLEVSPGEIVVIPRGVKFKVDLAEKRARGYICENFGLPFRLPELGVIGANGLANPRDFEIPVAAYYNATGDFKLLAKFQGHLWEASLQHSPLDVVAWHGNYVPYKYNLNLFNTVNSVSFDHIDPSVFTVLSSPSPHEGIANVDFVIFPPRWMVADGTFRPPYFHRNIMSEFMGLINGTYDAKESGFCPGGSSLHNCMSAHGPDKAAYEKAINSELKPEYYTNSLAFMFESKQVWRLSQFAYTAPFRQNDYLECWQDLKPNFSLVE